jgi:CheY-like chemotaxis protein
VRTPQGPPESPPGAPEPSPVPDPEVDTERLVLVADPDEARGKATAEAIEAWGLTPLLVHDGVEAMLAIQRTLPATIVLDAGLPKMFGFQICEVVKRNESLRETKVVLVGAIHHQDRYRRDPSDLYGADVYIESPDLPDGLLPLLRDAGLSVPDSGGDGPHSPMPTPEADAPPEPTPETITDPTPDPTPEPTLESPPETIPEPPPELELDLGADAPSMDMPGSAAPSEHDMVAEAEDPERTAERERAQRLARIAVSEMVLYQPEKFDQATRDGSLEQALDLEIQEARALLRQRIGEEVRAETDFIIDELNRVAQERGGQG